MRFASYKNIVCAVAHMVVCVHQVVNYSIAIIDKTAKESNCNNSINYTYTSYYGPYFHTGGGIVCQPITSGLVRDKEYSVVVNVGIESQMIQSDEVLFSELERMISTFPSQTIH